MPPGIIDLPVLFSTLFVREIDNNATRNRQLKVNDLVRFSRSSRIPSLARISSTEQRFLDQNAVSSGDAYT